MIFENNYAKNLQSSYEKVGKSFFIEDDFLPYEIFIHFKERVFRLERI